MSDLAAIAMAVCAAAGAWAAQPLPLPVGAALIGLGLAARRPALLALGVALAASALAVRSWAGIHPPAIGPWSGTVSLVSDPADVQGAVTAVVRVRGKRVEAWARGAAGRRLAGRLAGERIELAGRLQPVPSSVAAALARRHVGARLTVDRVGRWSRGDPTSRLANGIRRTLVAGAASLPAERRALFAGFVLGDDRDQPPEVVDDFRASGLAHLLVVSGENVAFVLALFAPVSTRLGLRARLVAGLVVLVLFGVLTRWEPSVLRAEAMAALALVSATLGRPASRLRILALAVTALLLIDPLLVGSVGFLLSVGACTGIALLAAPFAAWLPGPRPLAMAAGTTLAAQVGVAPVLVPAFGGLPVATVPANLLAVPAAGPLTVWGMAAGMPAGLLGPPLAGLLHAPTSVLVGWVAAVARWSAAAPLGRLGLVHLAVLALVVVAGRAARARGSRGGVRCSIGGATAVVVLAALPVLRPAAVDGREVTPGARLWRGGGGSALVVDDVRSPARLLEAMHVNDVRRLDVVVVVRPGPAAARVVEPLLRRFPAGLVLAPAGHRLAQATVPPVGARVQVGAVVVQVEAAGPRLRVTVRSRRSELGQPGGAPAPPGGAGSPTAGGWGGSAAPRGRPAPVPPR